MNRSFPDINYFIATGVALLVMWAIFTFAGIALAEVSEGQAIRAIIGEASNQGYQGMLAVAVGIRNRNTLKGVYGVKAKHVDKQPQWVWDIAERAWRESEHNRIHSGTHWENVKAFGTPYWVSEMTLVYQHKDHNFYRELL
jgi:hypothetical protein